MELSAWKDIISEVFGGLLPSTLIKKLCVGIALVTLAGIIVTGDGTRASSNSFREYIAINVLFHGHKPLQCCRIQVLPSSVL